MLWEWNLTQEWKRNSSLVNLTLFHFRYFFPVPLWLTAWFSTVCQSINTQSLKKGSEECKSPSIVTDSFSLSLQSDHGQLFSLIYYCCCNFRRIHNIKCAAFYWKCPRLSAGNSLQRRFSPRMNTDCHEKINHVPYSMHAPFPSDQVSVVQADRVQLYCQKPDKKPKGLVTWLQIALGGWWYCNEVVRCVSSFCSSSNKNVLQGKL